MRKQLVRTILVNALLCASAFAQRAEVLGEAPFPELQPSYSSGGNTALIGDFQEVWNSVAVARLLQGRSNSCASAGSLLLDFVTRRRDAHGFEEVLVWQLPDSRAFFFVSGMTIDADGSPNAYHPNDTGLDELANAGSPAHWDGIITDRHGSPFIQQESDPFPGYYISCTSLADRTKEFADPTRYVDASKIPYVVLPQDVADRGGARLGDFAFVMNLRNRQSSFAIYADIGTVGEGSIALAEALGIRPDARYGGASNGILYLLFPGSGNLQPRTIDEIQREGDKLLYQWGGMNGLFACAESNDSAPRVEGYRGTTGN